MAKQDKAISEILESEKSYVEDMIKWNQNFKRKMRVELRNYKFNTKNLIDRVFFNYNEIFKLHETYLKELTTETVIFVFTKIADKEDLYGEYVMQLPRADYELRLRISTSTEFNMTLNDFLKAENAETLNYNHFLFRPLQKFARYPLLFKAVTKYDSKYDYLVDLYMKKVKNIDRKYGEAQNYFKIYEIAKHLHTKSSFQFVGFDLMSKTRELICEFNCNIFVNEQKLERKILIFDHLIIIVEEVKNNLINNYFIETKIFPYQIKELIKNISADGNFILKISYTQNEKYKITTSYTSEIHRGFLILEFKRTANLDFCLQSINKIINKSKEEIYVNINIVQVFQTEFENIFEVVENYQPFEPALNEELENNNEIQQDQRTFFYRLFHGEDYFAMNKYLYHSVDIGITMDHKIVSTDSGIYCLDYSTYFKVSDQISDKTKFLAEYKIIIILCNSNIMFISLTETFPSQLIYKGVLNFFVFTRLNNTYIAILMKSTGESIAIELYKIDNINNEYVKTSCTRELFVNTEVYSLRSIHDKLILSVNSFDIVDPDSLITSTFVHENDLQLQNYLYVMKQKPMMILKLNNDSFLLCYQFVGVFVSKFGNNNRDICLLWNDVSVDFRIIEDKLWVIGEISITCYDLETGKVIFYSDDNCYKFLNGKNSPYIHDKSIVYKITYT